MSKTVKIILSVFLILAAVFSCVFLGRASSEEEAFKGTKELIEKQRTEVLTLSTTVATTAVGISMLHDDWGEPIANEIADYSDYFLIIFAVLFAEKTMITIFGTVSCRILIPLSLIILAVGILNGSKTVREFSAKLLAFGLALILVIPVGMRVSEMINVRYQLSKQELAIDAESELQAPEAVQEAEVIAESTGLIGKIRDSVVGNVNEIKDKALDTMNAYLEDIAVLIVTSCVIPLLCGLSILWLFKWIFRGLFAGLESIGKGSEEKEYSMQ